MVRRLDLPSSGMIEEQPNVLESGFLQDSTGSWIVGKYLGINAR